MNHYPMTKDRRRADRYLSTCAFITVLVLVNTGKQCVTRMSESEVSLSVWNTLCGCAEKSLASLVLRRSYIKKLLLT